MRAIRQAILHHLMRRVAWRCFIYLALGALAFAITGNLTNFGVVLLSGAAGTLLAVTVLREFDGVVIECIALLILLPISSFALTLGLGNMAALLMLLPCALASVWFLFWGSHAELPRYLHSRACVAMHEAGHAVVGNYVGGPSVPMHAALQGAGGGYVETLSPQTHNSQELQGAIATSLAGFVVEAMMGELSHERAYRSDMRNVGARAEILMHRHGWTLREIIEEGLRTTGHLAVQHWDEIQRFAAELARRGSMNKEEINAFFGRAP